MNVKRRFTRTGRIYLTLSAPRFPDPLESATHARAFFAQPNSSIADIIAQEMCEGLDKDTATEVQGAVLEFLERR